MTDEPIHDAAYHEEIEKVSGGIPCQDPQCLAAETEEEAG